MEKKYEPSTTLAAVKSPDGLKNQRSKLER